MTDYTPIEDNKKIPRVRSVSYPSITLGESIELTGRIYKIFGNITYTSRDVIAKQLHISESHLQTQISSCVQFGLLELRSKEGYKPTDLFIRARSPLPEENLGDIFKEIFCNPELYKAIIEQFNGKRLPEEAGLATILYRKLKVAEKVADFAARVFIESAKETGFLKNDDTLFVGEGRVEVENIEVIEDKKSENGTSQYILLPSPPERKSEPPETSDVPPIPIFLDNGETAKLYMPKGFTKDDLKRVAKVITAYIE